MNIEAFTIYDFLDDLGMDPVRRRFHRKDQSSTNGYMSLAALYQSSPLAHLLFFFLSTGCVDETMELLGPGEDGCGSRYVYPAPPAIYVEYYYYHYLYTSPYLPAPRPCIRHQ
tara:strand:- start:1397 stop:1735 length:339 start_codon:yes stop_codon:yes gene_type:complete